MAILQAQIKIYSVTLETFSVIFLYKRKSLSAVYSLQVKTQVMKIIHNIAVNFRSALNMYMLFYFMHVYSLFGH